MIDKDSNLDNQIIFAIDENGRIFSVPEIESETVHFQPYRRLNVMLDNKIGVIREWDTSTNLPKRVAKLGYINIYPTLVFDLDAGFRVVFPKNKTTKQLEALESLYDVLEKKEGISFFKKTILRNEDLYFEEFETGLEELKCFVREEIKIIRENYKNYEGR